jgi:hypothetical protein
MASAGRLAMAAFVGPIDWYAARTMWRFHFAANPASDPKIHPRLKELVPRLLLISIPGMRTLCVADLAHASTAVHPAGLRMFAGALAAVTALVTAYVF